MEYHVYDHYVNLRNSSSYMSSWKEQYYIPVGGWYGDGQTQLIIWMLEGRTEVPIRFRYTGSQTRAFRNHGGKSIHNQRQNELLSQGTC